VFDSGLGGLTVYRELKASLPDADYVYIADNAAFPYGGLHEDELVTRLLMLFETLIDREKPDVCVIACNTASTIALEPLRGRFKTPFVGTVPAIKTAAEKTETGLFSVLATKGTVKRLYTRDLIERYARSCDVTLVGAPDLANLAEQFMRGEKVDEEQLLQEISPAFITRNGRNTDIVVLGCTHFPLLIEQMHKVAPWTVRYIDPAPAIARRTGFVLSQMTGHRHLKHRMPNRLIYTGNDDIVKNTTVFLQDIGLVNVYRDEIIR
jgi:glutamate racemase